MKREVPKVSSSLREGEVEAFKARGKGEGSNAFSKRGKKRRCGND